MTFFATLAPNNGTIVNAVVCDVGSTSRTTRQRVSWSAPVIPGSRENLACSGVKIDGRTRVNRTAIRFAESRRRSPITKHRCFVFRLFHRPLRRRGRDPPGASGIQINHSAHLSARWDSRSRDERPDRRSRTISPDGPKPALTRLRHRTTKLSFIKPTQIVLGGIQETDHENPHTQPR